MTVSKCTTQWFAYIILIALTVMVTFSFYHVWHQDWITYREAETQFQQKNFEEAAKLYQRSIDLGVPVSVAGLNLALSYVVSGKFEEALPVYREYLLHHPENKEGRLAYAKALTWAGHDKEAEEEYQKVIDDAD